jgi:hypothetical protein
VVILKSEAQREKVVIDAVVVYWKWEKPRSTRTTDVEEVGGLDPLRSWHLPKAAIVVHTTAVIASIEQ